MTMEEEKNGEALISSLLKTTTMATEDEEIGPTLTSPYPCFLKSPSIVPESSPLLGSESMEKLEFEDFMNYDKKACEMEEGDNGLNENYIPTEVVEPKCGMIFDTAEEAYTFYNRYARKIGFSVRKLRTNNSRADRNKILQQFISEHTHDLVPAQNAHYLRSQRRIEFSQVGLIDKMHSSGFKPSDIYSYMSTEVGAGLLELEAKVDSWVSSKSAVQNDASKAQSTSTLNVDVEAPLRDPAKRKRRGQGNKRKRGPLEGKQPKKKTPCKRKGGKGEDSTTEAMTKTSQPFKEVEQDENIHDTTSAQGPHVEQPNMAQRSPFQSRIMEADVGLNGLQVPNSSCTSWRASHPTFTEMLLGEDREIKESLGDGDFETCFDNVMSNQEAVDSIKSTKDAESAAKHLIDETLSRKSRDDISCIVVKFQ
ncbi:hypothetical protein Vadar_012721 [Vaccinium darrowii]|uniref:Uncharacterized protein n=1 Tax=Vaccinium darrowii TaxID=229202 RepID=A0ACB7YWW3_9ERIC|nr:hypothetical protein Vadar_012721 [Vaccinium darrowii]